MLNDNELNVISEAMSPLFDYLEHEVIADVARRIKKTMTLTRTAELEAMNMKKLGYSPSEIRKRAFDILQADKAFQREVNKNTIEYKKDIKELIDDIVNKAMQEGNELIASAGNMSWIDDMSVWESHGDVLTDNGFLNTLIRAMQRQTGIEIINLTQTTGFKGISGWESIENLYRLELNKALIKTFSGALSQTSIVKDTVHNLAQSGLRSIDYGTGRTMQLDSAVRLAVRTGAHQLSGQIQKEAVAQTDVNLIYVSEHENARNKGEGIVNHESWQGKVYYFGEYSEAYAEEAKRIGQSDIKDLWEATGYSIDDKRENNPLGLYGYNCRHITYPWFIGASELPEPIRKRPVVEYRGKSLDGYAQTQEMRRQEANIRRLKREKEALATLGEDTRPISNVISDKTKEYRQFCRTCGMNPRNANLTYECGTSDYRKTEAWKRFEKLSQK